MNDQLRMLKIACSRMCVSLHLFLVHLSLVLHESLLTHTTQPAQPRQADGVQHTARRSRPDPEEQAHSHSHRRRRLRASQSFHISRIVIKLTFLAPPDLLRHPRFPLSDRPLRPTARTKLPLGPRRPARHVRPRLLQAQPERLLLVREGDLSQQFRAEPVSSVCAVVGDGGQVVEELQYVRYHKQAWNRS